MFKDEREKEFHKAKEKLIDYLSRRDHSELELRQKMSRFFDLSIIEQVIDWVKERKLLPSNDELSKQIIRRLEKKNKSFQYIVKYLKERGLPSGHFDQEKEIQKAMTLLLTQGKSKLEREKKIRFLVYRGFDRETIRRVIYEKP